MSKQTAETLAARSEAIDSRRDLDRQYGTIGISAVAAALHYSGNAKNPAYAPARSQANRRSEFDTRSVFVV